MNNYTEFRELLETDLPQAMEFRISELEEESQAYMIAVGIAQVTSGGLLASSLIMSLTPFAPVVAMAGVGTFTYTFFRDYFTTGKVLAAPYYRLSLNHQMQQMAALQARKMYGEHYIVEKDKDHDVTASLPKKAVAEYRMLINYSHLVVRVLQDIPAEKRWRKYDSLISKHRRGDFPSRMEIESENLLNAQMQPTIIQPIPATPNLSTTTPTPLPEPSSLNTENAAEVLVQERVLRSYASDSLEKEVVAPTSPTLNSSCSLNPQPVVDTTSTPPVRKPEPLKDIPERPNPDLPQAPDKGQEKGDHIQDAVQEEVEDLTAEEQAIEELSPQFSFPYAPTPATTFDWLDNLETDDEPNCKHISNYLDLLLMRSLLLVGAQGSGKTTLARYLMDQKIARGQAVLVVNPHGTKGQWGSQVKLVGGGRNYWQISEFMSWYMDELDSRYERLHDSGMDEDSFIQKLVQEGRIISPICEEMSSWQCNLDKELMHKFVMTGLTESRKVVMPIIQISHSRNLSFVGLKEGADLRDAGLIQVVLDPPITGEGGRPISTGKATIYVPGGDTIRVRFDKQNLPTNPPPPDQKISFPPVLETDRPTLLLDEKHPSDEEVREEETPISEVTPEDDFQPLIEYVKKKKAPVRASEVIAGVRFYRDKYKTVEAVKGLFAQAEELGIGFIRWVNNQPEFFVL